MILIVAFERDADDVLFVRPYTEQLGAELQQAHIEQLAAELQQAQDDGILGGINFKVVGAL